MFEPAVEKYKFSGSNAASTYQRVGGPDNTGNAGAAFVLKPVNFDDKLRSTNPNMTTDELGLGPAFGPHSNSMHDAYRSASSVCSQNQIFGAADSDLADSIDHHRY